jgi:hypothetical protein
LLFFSSSSKYLFLERERKRGKKKEKEGSNLPYLTPTNPTFGTAWDKAGTKQEQSSRAPNKAGTKQEQSSRAWNKGADQRSYITSSDSVVIEQSRDKAAVRTKQQPCLAQRTKQQTTESEEVAAGTKQQSSRWDKAAGTKNKGAHLWYASITLGVLLCSKQTFSDSVVCCFVPALFQADHPRGYISPTMLEQSRNKGADHRIRRGRSRNKAGTKQQPCSEQRSTLTVLGQSSRHKEQSIFFQFF